MNERIEELAQGCFEYFGGTDIVEFNYKKFAELIVRECMDQVWYTREDMINDNISEVIKLRIKEHFGVEE